MLAAVVALIVTACAGAPTSGQPTTSPAASPSRTGAPSASPSIASAAPTSVAVLPGEPWLSYSWFLPGTDHRAIFLARPDGSDAHRVMADLPGNHSQQSWSPDGSRFAFVTEKSIWTARADGSEPALLTDGEGMCPDGVYYPDWAQDGSKLALICYTDVHSGGGSVATFDLATKALTVLYTVHWPEHLDVAPRWSPDGSSIVFAILHWDPTDQFLDGSLVAVVPTTGGEARRLTTFETSMSSPDWSPDGFSIVMNSQDMGNMHTTDKPSNLYLINPDGTGQRQITRSSVDGNRRIVMPRWTPDGTRILVSIGLSSKSNMTTDDLQLAVIETIGEEPVLLSPTIHGAGPDLRPFARAP
jgi:Tol biopolymer transport system component